MSREAELEAITVGQRRPLNAPVTLCEHDPEWPATYEVLAARVRAALGARAKRLHHAGSTSVPGLAAKPIIDMVLEVEDSADEAGYFAALEAAGFALRIREPNWFEHRCFSPADPAANLHVFSEGCEEVGRMLTFRDHLRRDEADRKLYQDTKRALAARTWAYMQDYADAKTEVVNTIMARAGRI